MEQKLNKRFKSTECLKKALQRAWDEISEEQCADIVANFRMRLDAYLLRVVILNICCDLMF